LHVGIVWSFLNNGARVLVVGIVVQSMGGLDGGPVPRDSRAADGIWGSATGRCDVPAGSPRVAMENCVYSWCGVAMEQLLPAALRTLLVTRRACRVTVDALY
jgi:hypothetical protein